MFCIAILAAIVILILVAIVTRARTDEYVVKGMILNIISDSANREGAIALMTECNSRMLRLFDHLRKKYKIGTTDAECKDKCAEWIAQNHSKREIVRHLLRDFNYEAIHEHRPQGSRNVAYSLNKGKTIMLCLREIKNPREIVDIDTLMFVVLHEAAHVANYSEWGHETRFWSIFKYILEEAVAVGVYVPTDYSASPKNYCGFNINHNPLYDQRIESIASA
jgi:hypothetical protein